MTRTRFENFNPNLLKSHFNRLGFTLIELLIVFAVVGILATVAVIIINPSEIMKEVRDSKRFEELNHINIAITEAQSLSPNINLGVASSVYVSIPDSSATCANLGLSTSSLPSGWSYRCSSSANFRKTDGTGWIPVNFSSVEGGSVFASLPIDPINATSSGLHYTYTPGNGFQLTALFESFKHADKAAKDGGVDLAQYETGDNLSLAPFSHGIVGYWNFDETGTIANDVSGFNNAGTMYSSTSVTNLHISSGCKANLGTCVNFDGIDDYIQISSFNWGLPVSKKVSVVFWLKASNPGPDYEIWGFNTPCCFHSHMHIPNLEWHYGGSSLQPNYLSYFNNWTHVVFITENTLRRVYLNGTLVSSAVESLPSSNFSGLIIGQDLSEAMSFYPGLIDQFSIYRRVLTTAQIKAIYDATK